MGQDQQKFQVYYIKIKFFEGNGMEIGVQGEKGLQFLLKKLIYIFLMILVIKSLQYVDFIGCILNSDRYI